MEGLWYWGVGGYGMGCGSSGGPRCYGVRGCSIGARGNDTGAEGSDGGTWLEGFWGAQCRWREGRWDLTRPRPSGPAPRPHGPRPHCNQPRSRLFL